MQSVGPVLLKDMEICHLKKMPTLDTIFYLANNQELNEKSDLQMKNVTLTDKSLSKYPKTLLQTYKFEDALPPQCP